METGAITGSLDVAQLTLYAFWVFFAGLIWYLRQEDRREGYPLESDVGGRYSRDPWLFVPKAKTFVLPHGHGVAKAPTGKRDTRPIAAERIARGPGYPSAPTGNPMLAGVGPGSWAERADVLDTTMAGAPKIVPLRAAPDFSVAAEDMDPRGMSVVGCDGKVAGQIADAWIDRSECMIRYYEVDTGARRVLLPANFTVFRSGRGARKHAYVHAITSAQFADVPGTKAPEQITMLEEERVVAYFGAGQLYATPRRQEPLL